MAVYTKVSFEQAQSLLKDYPLGELLSLTEIMAGVENTNYFLTTSTGKYVLTLFEKRVNIDDLPYFMGLTEHLAKGGISCPKAIYNNHQQNITTLAGKKAVIISFLRGASKEPPHLNDCLKAGHYLGQIHKVQKGFSLKRDNQVSLENWSDIYQKILPHIDHEFSHFKNTIEKEMISLEKHWPITLPNGHIHADFFPDNIFFLEDNISGVIDFYFACYDFLAYDLAITINAWCFDKDGTFHYDRAQQMFMAYDAVRPLEAAEMDHFYILLKGAAMRFLLTRLHDWIFHPTDALVTPKDPREYFHILNYYHTLTSDIFMKNIRICA